MGISPLAGKPAPRELLIDVGRLLGEYAAGRPDPADPRQRVAFGTSGHRGTPDDGSFTEMHIVAITQAICEYRSRQGVTGPVFMGKDTHAVSGPAQDTALEVLAGNGVATIIQPQNGFIPTPVVSHAILTHNRGRKDGLADGIIITPSHNPPRDGGFKYNPPNGGPADTDATSWIQDRANALLRDGNKGVRRVPLAEARRASTTIERDMVTPYVRDLGNVIGMDAAAARDLSSAPTRSAKPPGGSPAGRSSTRSWGLGVEVVNPKLDPTFAFMTVDHDGQIRMDCSSPYAMASLVGLKDRYQVAFANDPDSDRHGIVTPSAGLMNPNHFLAVAIDYLLTHRPGWPAGAEVGKTLVSSGLIDRVVARLGRKLYEVPVGFKWFAPGLFDGSVCFGGEESAGASFLRRDGSVWTTDKDGIIMDLLAAEITAKTGRDPGEHFHLRMADVLGMCPITRASMRARRPRSRSKCCRNWPPKRCGRPSWPASRSSPS